MQNVYYPKMFKGSIYAERLPIGDMDIVNNAPYKALKRYYKDWYRPDLMAVIEVGDIDVAKIEVQVKTLFCDIEPVEDARVRLMYKHDKKEVKTMADYKKSLAAHFIK